MSTYSYDHWDAAAEEAMHNSDLYEETVHCDRCGIRMLPSEVVSPKDWAEVFCRLCVEGEMAEREAL
jgi:hypothetical protein